MNPRSVSISGMMGLVLVVALLFAAFKSPTVFFTNLAASIVLALLLTAVVGAIYLRGFERTYWAGFAIFGWSTLLLVNGSWITGQFGPDLTSGFRDMAETLLPSPRMLPATPVAGTLRMAATFAPDPAANSMSLLAERSVKVGNLVQIARLFMVLVFALLGGFIARGFAIRAERTAQSNESRSATRNHS